MHIHRKFRSFFSRSYALFELKNLTKMKDTTVFIVSATPLKLLDRISFHFVVMKDIMYRCAYPQDILIQFSFWEQCPSLNFEIWWKWKIRLKQLFSTTPLKPLNRIVWNFVVMKDIMCRYVFLPASPKAKAGLGVQSLRPSVCPSVRPSVRPSVCPSVRPSVRSHWNELVRNFMGSFCTCEEISTYEVHPVKRSCKIKILDKINLKITFGLLHPSISWTRGQPEFSDKTMN